MADRGALTTIGMMLGVATVLVNITAAVVVGNYRSAELQSAANVARNATTFVR
jgi:hypothetical protein